MPNPRLATRYAKSLLDLATERGELETIYNDISWLQEVCKANRPFVSMLRSPVITGDKKEKIVQAVSEGKLSRTTSAFIHLMIQKGREYYLPEVLPAFINQYKAHKNIYTIKLTTVTPISDELKEAILSQVRATSNMKEIELQTFIDESLVGGFVLEAGDQLIDGSIAYDLKNIAKQFDNNDFIYKIR